MNKISDKFISEIKASLRQLKRSLERFPLTIIITWTLVLIAIAATHSNNPEDYKKAAMLLALGMPLSATLKIIGERNNRLKLLYQAIVLTFFIGSYYFAIPENMDKIYTMKYFSLLGFFYASFFISPYFHKRTGFSLFLVERIGKFFLTALYAIIIYLGINALFFSVEGLFELNFPNELPLDIFYIVSGFFGVPFFLGSMAKIEEDEDVNQFSKILKTLFLYILIPIQVVYTAVLYAYFIRLLILKTLPQGLIGNLVLWYALISFLTLFLVKDLRGAKPWLRLYTRIFSAAISIPMIMLFVAIYIRVSAYGLTAPRYLSLITAFYLSVSYLILLISRKDIAIPVYTLGMVLLFSSFYGFFSWDNVVLRNQNSRLEAQFISSGFARAEDGWSLNGDLDDDKKRELSQTIYYLTDLYEASKIDALPSDFDIENSASSIGFELDDRYSWNLYKDNFYDTFFEQNMVFDTREIDYLLAFDKHSSFKAEVYDKIKIEKLSDSSEIRISENETVIKVIDADILAKEARKNMGVSDLIEFEITLGDKLIIEALFLNVSGELDEEKKASKIHYYQGWLKIKRSTNQ